jgi:hypothetical protein
MDIKQWSQFQDFWLENISNVAALLAIHAIKNNKTQLADESRDKEVSNHGEYTTLSNLKDSISYSDAMKVAERIKNELDILKQKVL